MARSTKEGNTSIYRRACELREGRKASDKTDRRDRPSGAEKQRGDRDTVGKQRRQHIVYIVAED